MIPAAMLLDAVIRPACRSLAAAVGEPRLDTTPAHALLLRIAAVESRLEWRRQRRDGPGSGWWQVEPLTAADMLSWMAMRRHWRAWARILCPSGAADRYFAADVGAHDWASIELQQRLIVDPFFACQMARVKLWRAPDPLPIQGDVRGQARYWKRHYNTELGAGTIEDFLGARRRLLQDLEERLGWVDPE